MALKRFLPPRAAVIGKMPRHQVGHVIAAALLEREQQRPGRAGEHFNNLLLELEAAYPGEDAAEARSAFGDAWALLQSRAMLRPSATGIVQGFVELTEEGKRFASAEDAGRYASVDLLPSGLDQRLIAQVEKHVVASDLDEAVEAAFQEVEHRWKASGQGKLDGLTSSGLAQAAFKEKDGPLTDPRLQPKVQAGIRNFAASAMAAFRTVYEHSYPKLQDRNEALELIYTAALLIRLGERGAAARSGK